MGCVFGFSHMQNTTHRKHTQLFLFVIGAWLDGSEKWTHYHSTNFWWCRLSFVEIFDYPYIAYFSAYITYPLPQNRQTFDKQTHMQKVDKKAKRLIFVNFCKRAHKL